MAVAPTVFFLSDYGVEDEFVGVVHAVIAAQAPATRIIDLTHAIAPFDVRAGSHTLCRAVPHIGSGVVLGVVDPGVGTDRRGIALEVTRADGGMLCFVGPDNGLLVSAAEEAAEAPVGAAVELRRDRAASGAGATFDGRDLFAPAAAALAAGTPLSALGDPVASASLVRLAGQVVEQSRLPDGRTCLRAEITWMDHFGNLQLAATVADARAAGLSATGRVQLAGQDETAGAQADGRPRSVVPGGVLLRCVETFGDLAHGELGLLGDANGHLAVVAREASAAHLLDLSAGELVTLAW